MVGKKLGRPKLPSGVVKDVIRPVRFTQAELRLFEKAAKASEHKTLSAWIRVTLRERVENNDK